MTSTPAWWDLATKSGFWLLSRIRSSKGPVAFIDESFRSPAENQDSFYILGAVVIPRSKLFDVRAALFEIVGDDYFHATELGRSDQGRMVIRRMAALLARQTKTVLVVIEQLKPSDANAESAREAATRELMRELSEEHIYLNGTVVYEKRLRGSQHARDLRIFKNLKRLKLPGAKLRVIGLASKNEPLLWAPDLACWGFRQAYQEGDPSFFQELTRSAKIIRL